VRDKECHVESFEWREGRGVVFKKTPKIASAQTTASIVDPRSPEAAERKRRVCPGDQQKIAEWSNVRKTDSRAFAARVVQG